MQGYAGFYNSLGQAAPLGSRLSGLVFGGMSCPEKISFSRVHGPAPGSCDVDLTGAQQAQAGSLQTIQVDGASFVGYVIGVQVSQTDEEGYTTHIKLVDAREKLYGHTTACQLNMLDSVGRWYHIIPSEWKFQTKRYLSEVDLTGQSESEPSADCNGGLFSAYTILNLLSGSYGFSLDASSNAARQLKSTKPINVDWNNGIKVIEAIDEIVSYCGLQFTAYGNLNIYVSRRGDVDDPMSALLLLGSSNICSLPNATKASNGSELNDKGNKAVVVGGMNRFEFSIKCKPSWAPGFTAEVMFVGTEFAAMLNTRNLSLSSTMEDLRNFTSEDKWEDKRNFNGKPVMKMTIKDYMQTFPFKVFALDLDDDSSITTEDSPGDGEQTATGGHTGGSKYRIAESLVTDQNIKFLVKATIAVDDFKAVPPRREEKRVYFTEGVELIVEEELRKRSDSDNCAELYFAYVKFDTYRINWKIEDENNKANWKVDTVTCRIAVEAGKYVYQTTGSDPATRQRTTVKVDNNIFRSFIHPGVPFKGTSRGASGDLPQGLAGKGMKEVPLLRLATDPEAASAGIKVYAEDVAKIIASDVVNNDTVNSAGFVQFTGVAGFMPNGFVDNVAVNFSADEGSTETVNFTTDRNVPASLTDQRSRVIGFKGKVKYHENNTADYILKELEKLRKEQKAAAELGAKIDGWLDGRRNEPAPKAAAPNADNAVMVTVKDDSEPIEATGVVVVAGANDNTNTVFDYDISTTNDEDE